MTANFAQHTLIQVIKTSLAGLRSAVRLLAEQPSKLAVDMVTAEADALSEAISALRRVIGSFDQLLPPDHAAAPQHDGIDYLAVAEFLSAVEQEPCARCGLPHRIPEPPAEPDGAELSQFYRGQNGAPTHQLMNQKADIR